jgi:pimeloyl-[acyl-carrier protein] methyl ester esterase
MPTSPHEPTDLVLLHGWGMNNGVWDALPDALGAPYRLHPIGLPGHGDAAFEPHWRDLPDWADAVLAQAPERAVWLGWSLGGLIALQAALQTRALETERITALILISATPRFVQSADWSAAMPDERFEQFHSGLLADPRQTLQRFLALQVRGSDDERETLRRLRAGIGERPSPQTDALIAGLDLLREGDLRARLADIREPALWLFGQRDTLVPASVAARIELLMPGARCRSIAGAGHAPLHSHGAAAAAAITAFLSGRS